MPARFADHRKAQRTTVNSMTQEGNTLWHGRFAGGPAADLMAFTVSLHYDKLLATHDIAGSHAHVKGLVNAGLLTKAEANSIHSALNDVVAELADGSFTFLESDEDIHTAVERRVTEIAGDAGGKLHTGRSRNDQIATDIRLFCKLEIKVLIETIIEFQKTLLQRAKDAGDAYLPGYTHMQRAQPVPLAHHLAAHGWALSRDVDRLFDCYRRLDVSTLGAGALAGSSLPLDPDFTAKELGFAKRFNNSLDAVSDRDHIAELLFDTALVGVHLSRIGEEIILWTTDEFGFMKLDDAYSTGSSMMPQKKNPDIGELTRGKSGRLIGNLSGLLATLKGLPLAYNRDLQEDKEPLFDSLVQARLALVALNGLVSTATFNIDRMREAANAPEAVATDLAEFLVQRNVPFRKAHAIVGELVRRSLDGEGALVDLVREDKHLGEDAAALFEPGKPVSRRITSGGAGIEPVARQLLELESVIAESEARLIAL